MTWLSSGMTEVKVGYSCMMMWNAQALTFLKISGMLGSKSVLVPCLSFAFTYGGVLNEDMLGVSHSLKSL